MKWTLVIHGGAGMGLLDTSLPRETYYKGIEDALEAGSAVLREGGRAVDAVAAAVACMEDNPLFNAGE